MCTGCLGLFICDGGGLLSHSSNCSCCHCCRWMEGTWVCCSSWPKNGLQGHKLNWSILLHWQLWKSCSQKLPQKSVVSVSLLPAHALKLQIIAPTTNCHALLWTQFLLADDSQWGAMTGSYCYSGVLCEFLQAPELFTMSPALAIPKAIANAGIEQSQVNFYDS